MNVGGEQNAGKDGDANGRVPHGPPLNRLDSLHMGDTWASGVFR